MGQIYEIGQIVEYLDLVDRREQIRFPEAPTAKWFCAVTNPNCQARACLGLYQAGYRTFYPKVRRWVSHARVKTAKEKPLLGRYIFVELDPENDRQSFFQIRAVNGIECILSSWQETRFGHAVHPTPFPSDWIEGMRKRQMTGEWDYTTKEPLPIGARIRLMEGEFADMLATVTGRNRGKMVKFKLLGENRYSQLHAESVRAA